MNTLLWGEKWERWSSWSVISVTFCAYSQFCCMILRILHDLVVLYMFSWLCVFDFSYVFFYTCICLFGSSKSFLLHWVLFIKNSPVLFSTLRFFRVLLVLPFIFSSFLFFFYLAVKTFYSFCFSSRKFFVIKGCKLFSSRFCCSNGAVNQVVLILSAFGFLLFLVLI